MLADLETLLGVRNGGRDNMCSAAINIQREQQSKIKAFLEKTNVRTG